MFYTGGNDLETEGDFKWLDGTLVETSYTNWYPGEPTNAHQSEHCIIFYDPAISGIANLWNDVTCHQFVPAICEYQA